jgi:hypothetical protein
MLKQLLKGKMAKRGLAFAGRHKRFSLIGLLGYLGWRNRARIKGLVTRSQRT